MLEDGEQEASHLFALVTYIPDPLGPFLDNLRRELVPGISPRSHVTVLPPRLLSVPRSEAIAALRRWIVDFGPFEIEAGRVEVFPRSDVVYLEIGAGRKDLYRMHQAMNVGPLKFDEPYPYHPHITLAQDLTHEQSIELAKLARRRWSEYPYQRAFTVESMDFVQSSDRKIWRDLARFELEPATPVRRRR